VTEAPGGPEGDSPWIRTLEQIRRTLATRERLTIDRPDLRQAAVLLPIFEHEGALHLLFTLRTDTVRHHKGQVSFPGGGRHEEDADLLGTALRESDEEIGLKSAEVDVLGALDDMITITRYVITPYVGRIPWPYPFVPSPIEIADIFSVPLDTLRDPALVHIEEREFDGHVFYPIYYFRGGTHLIWGVTGHLLSHFLEEAFTWTHPDLDPARCTSREDIVNHWLRMNISSNPPQ